MDRHLTRSLTSVWPAPTTPTITNYSCRIRSRQGMLRRSRSRRRR